MCLASHEGVRSPLRQHIAFRNGEKRFREKPRGGAHRVRDGKTILASKFPFIMSYRGWWLAWRATSRSCLALSMRKFVRCTAFQDAFCMPLGKESQADHLDKWSRLAGKIIIRLLDKFRPLEDVAPGNMECLDFQLMTEHCGTGDQGRRKK